MAAQMYKVVEVSFVKSGRDTKDIGLPHMPEKKCSLKVKELNQNNPGRLYAMERVTK